MRSLDKILLEEIWSIVVDTFKDKSYISGILQRAFDTVLFVLLHL